MDGQGKETSSQDSSWRAVEFETQLHLTKSLGFEISRELKLRMKEKAILKALLKAD